MRNYTTQMDAARQGIITPEMKAVAKKEYRTEENIRDLVARGQAVICANKLHTCIDPNGVGSMLRTKINVNLGVSRDCKDYDVEMRKVMAAVDMGAEAIMDLSSHGNTQPFRRKLTSECPAMIGTVPVYDSVIHYQRDLATLTARDFIDVIRLHAEDGVDFVTLHCGITRKTIEQIRTHKRKINIVSRGGSLVFAWMSMTGEENPFYEYFDDILDYEAYGNLFCSIARILVREKKGLEEDSFSEELQQIVDRDYSSNLGKASVNRAMDWLYSSGIIGFAGKVINSNILDFRAKARCYFMDLGLTSFFLKQIGCEDSDIKGIVSENFVYLDLKRRSGYSGEFAFEMPAFATWGRGELDFYTKSLNTGKTYVIEVKAGKNRTKTAMEVLEKGKADCLLMAKGSTHGGIADQIYTIPIYGI